MGASGAVAMPQPGPNQAVIDGADMPRKLSEFGIFRAGTSEPVDALLPYTLHTPLFSDYAEKHRLIWVPPGQQASVAADGRSEEHTSELQSLMRTSYAVFCLNN